MNLSEARRLLGIRSNSTGEEINRAYRKRAYVVHPDRNPHDPDAGHKFTHLTEARDLALRSIGFSHGSLFQHRPAYRPAPGVTFDPSVWNWAPFTNRAERTVFDDLFDELRKSVEERGTQENFDGVFTVLGRAAKRASDEGRTDPTGIGILLGLGLLTSWLRRR